MERNEQEKYPTCAECPYTPAKRICVQKKGRGPDNCPTLINEKLNEEALRAANKVDTFEFVKQSSIQECEGYINRDQGYASVRPIKPRIQEIIEFANKMDYERLGLVFCIGLRKEAELVQKIFKTNDFEVVSVACKAGRVSKQELNLGKEFQIDMTASEETMCNPIYQAYLVNHYQAQLNILLGLCVGHDSMFLKHAEAYCTVLAVKDRLLGHNPLAAVYEYESYYRYLKKPLK